jgi:mannose-6-phosphate isomerase-like protein (cupin superfamily)
LIHKKTAEHYTWGEICDGWHLLKGETLSVIEERILSGGSEIPHHHAHARQFFYVLAGALSFEMNGGVVDVASRQGIEILVVSNPPTTGDRVAD